MKTELLTQFDLAAGWNAARRCSDLLARILIQTLRTHNLLTAISPIQAVLVADTASPGQHCGGAATLTGNLENRFDGLLTDGPPDSENVTTYPHLKVRLAKPLKLSFAPLE